MNKKTILRLNNNFTEVLRSKDNLVLLSSYRSWYGSRTMGITSTITSVDGGYSNFIYYD